MADQKISQLTQGTPLETDVIPYVDLVTGTTKKALKSELQGIQGPAGATGDTGPAGAAGDNAYVYIAYASDDSGTDFTTTFDANLDYIAIKSTDTEIVSPVVGDFVGLWKNYKGATGDTGPAGPGGSGNISGTGTANEIAYFTAENTIDNLPVATYPSLTEFSYVKGLTSSAQTQITAKAPSASPSFTGTITLSDNTRIDLTIPTADTYCTGNTTDSFAAGYSSAIGDLVFFGSSGKWLEADSDAVATCNGLMGIALEAKTDTQVMKVALPGSFVRLDSWNWTVGATLYAGETLGSMQETIPTGADAIIKVVGFAVSSDVIFFNPSPDQQSTVA